MTLPAGPTMGERVAESRRRHAEALQMGGEQAVDRYRASARLPVRERIALLLDEGSWFETGMLAQPERRTGKKVPGDGVVTGFGRVDGRTVGLIGIDATVLAGTTAPVSMRKQGRVRSPTRTASTSGVPPSRCTSASAADCTPAWARSWPGSRPGRRCPRSWVGSGTSTSPAR